MHKEVAVDKPFGTIKGPLQRNEGCESFLGSGARSRRLIPQCVTQLVNSQCRATPDAIAVSAGAETISYRELDLRATYLAVQLRALGVRPDSLVAICLDRSISFVIAALAVWKAGGAYLPVDISSPAERINFILKDAQVRVVLTQKALATAFSLGPWKIIDIDWELNFTLPSNGNFRDAQVSPENLAYVIYTSGSTGQPKGVEITHKGLFNLVTWHISAFEVTPFDRATQLSSVGFDAAVWELWPYLAGGASVHLADDETRHSPDRLQNWFRNHAITVSFVPTPLAERLLSLKWPSETSLRLLLTGADTLLQYPRPGLPFRLINNYGPTECTVVATSGCVHPTNHSSHPPSIGHPIQNVKIRLLDRDLREVECGSIGEIYIGGVSLARGYRNSPELTREKFIVDPSGKDSFARLFKTGDMAYFRPDGQLEFLGRIDDQIKIRGHRIEPKEIITVLRRHPAIEACTVVARKSFSGEKRLIAYVVTRPAPNIGASDLRAHLANHLPDYMLPETFVALPSLPLNKSGKVDRLALPLPNASNTLRDPASSEPRTPVEKRLAEILSNLLGVQHVSADDNFFLLGGHSLLGTQLIARVQDTFGIEVSLRALFDSPTIAELSAHIERLILHRLEAMSEEEAQRILGAQADPG
jgi:amino acid adenylation domain-containing protein